MGAQIAVWVALQEPKLIDRLVLTSPSGVEPYTLFEKQMLTTCMATIVASGNAFTHNHLTFIIGFNCDYELAVSLIAKLPYFKNEAVVFANMIYRSVAGMLSAPIDTVLSKLTQKCLVLIGSQDKVSPYNYLRRQTYADIAFEMAKRINDVRIHMLPENGYFIPYQKPEILNEEIEKFIVKEALQIR